MTTRTTTQIPDSPQKAAVQQAVVEAYAAEGYVQDNGTRDTTKVRRRIYEVVKPHKAINKGDRQVKAISRGQVLAQVFPHLLGPDRFSEGADPQLAQAVWNQLYQDVWSHLQPTASGAVQQLVEGDLGNGYVLLRTKLSPDNTDGVYITDDLKCIEEDLLVPEDESLQRKIRAMVATREMLIARQPGNAKRYAGKFDRQMKAVMFSGHDRLALAIETATSATVTDDDDNDDNAES